ncbi:MAG: sulfur oxidation c-type cytochrome SoxX [Xanthobacteraceae bacterium]
MRGGTAHGPALFVAVVLAVMLFAGTRASAQTLPGQVLLGQVLPGQVLPGQVLPGQVLAFDRSKGNCLTCHDIKGGDAPGNLGPPLADMKSRFSDRKELAAIVFDETKRNPQTVMPPFGRNLILTDGEIEAIVDFLYTR